MLTELTITDFAIIDNLRLELAPGFVVFTGETGAGKSIIIDAVELLLGGRAEATQVRAGADCARLEGVFVLQGETLAEVNAILAREALVDETAGGTLLTLARELRREGRSICRVNGRVVTLSLLKEIGERLVDVHGQSEHLSLLRNREQLFLIDRFGGLEAERAALALMVGEINVVRREITDLRRDEREHQRRLEMLDFQINEINAAKLKPGEDQALLQERNRLANAEKLANLIDEAIRALDAGDDAAPSAADLLGRAARALNSLVKLDATLERQREQAQELSSQFKELARELYDYRRQLEFNPKRLNAVEERLDVLRRLQRKYGATIDDVLAFAERATAERDSLTHSGERLAELERTEEALLRRIGQMGQKLSAARRSAGEHLARAVEAELNDLRLEGAKFAVAQQFVEDSTGAPTDAGWVAFDAAGLDRIEFLVAPNVGEGLRPLTKTASGGETSRLMLALKSVLAHADRTPTLIFDEIDQGIGGRVGAVVGRKLWELGTAHQVICVTHLPQLAGFGDQHFKVEKLVIGERTVTRVHLLEGGARTAELAQMLGGTGEKMTAGADEILACVAEAKAAGRKR